MGHKEALPANFHFTSSKADSENGAAGTLDNVAFLTATLEGMIEIVRSKRLALVATAVQVESECVLRRRPRKAAQGPRKREWRRGWRQ